MPAERRDDLQTALGERDGDRCRACGAAVDGGPTILCFPCHVTQGLRTYAQVLRTAAPNRLPEFVKQMTRDLGRNLLAYSEWIDPIRFTPEQAVEEFDMWNIYLDTLAGLAGAARGIKRQEVASNSGLPVETDK
jgi:hypothetical protein